MDLHWFVWFVIGSMGAFMAVLGLTAVLTGGD